MIVYPASLPAPQTNSYAVITDPGVAETQFESGAVRKRRIYTKSSYSISANFVFSLMEYTLFLGWWEYESKRGTVFATMQLDIGEGLSEYSARIKIDKSNRTNAHWKLDTTIEIDTVSTTSYADLNYLNGDFDLEQYLLELDLT